MKLLSVLVMFIPLTFADHHNINETKMSMYFQDFAAGLNIPAIPIAGIPGHLWTFTQFGTIYVTDDLITEGPELYSAPVGRGQGMYITSALDGGNSHVMVSVVFTNTAYNGSSLQMLGISKQFDSVREVSVVSGTDKFRLARGYATFETVFYDSTTLHSVIRCNVSLFHY